MSNELVGKKFQKAFQWKRLYDKLSAIPLWVFVLFIACFFFMIKGTITGGDSSEYISHALNIYKGHGYVNIDLEPVVRRGPVFPFLITIFFWLFGVSIKSVFWVIRIFYVANGLLVYYLGKKLYDKWTGLVASLLLLSSYTIIKESLGKPMPDVILTFFVFLFFTLIYIAFENRKYIWFALAGAVLGIAFLTKETAIFFAPLPILILTFVRSYRCKRNFYGLGIFIIGFLLVLLPWMIHMYMVKGRLFYILGADFVHFSSLIYRALASGGQNGGAFNLYSLLKKYIVGLINYYRSVSSNFNLPILFPLAWLVTLVSAIMGSKSNKIILAAFLLFSPAMVVLSITGFMLRQGMIIFYLSYIVLASSILMIGSYTLSAFENVWRNEKFNRAAKWLGVALISSFIVGQIWIGDGRGRKVSNYLVEKSYLVRKILRKDTKWEIGGKHSEVIRLTGKWLIDNVPRGSKIMMDYDLCRSINFFTDGEYALYSIPCIAVIRLVPNREKKYLMRYSEHAGYPYPVEKLLFLWSTVNTSDPRRSLNAIFEEVLLKKLKAIKYVIIGPRMNFLSLYFQDNPSFKLTVAFDNGAVKIFEVKDIKPRDKFEMRMGSKLPFFLRNLRDTNPEKYKRIVERVLMPCLNITDERVQMMAEETKAVRKRYAYAFHRRNDGYAIIRTSNGWKYMIQNSTGSTFGVVGGPVHIDKWTHLALVYDGKTLKAYENGEQVCRAVANGTVEINNAPLYIGSDVPGAKRFFRGIIDEVKIYKRALKPSEFHLPGKTEELVAYWNFDEGSGNRSFDSSPNGNDGIINGATYVKGFSGTGLFFDGNDDYILVPDKDSLDGMSELTVEMWVYPQLHRAKAGGFEMVEFNQRY